MTRSEQPRDAAAARIFPPFVPFATLLAGIGLSKLFPIDSGLEQAAPILRQLGGLVLLIATAFALWSIFILTRSGQDPRCCGNCDLVESLQ